MRSCITIKSSCNTEEKIKVLRDCIAHLKKKHSLPILLHAGYKVPSDIVDQVDYCIAYNNSVYGRENGLHEWRTLPDYPGTFLTLITEYGYAEFLQLMETAQFLRLHKYTHMHTINYDVDMNQFDELGCLEEHDLLLKDGYEACFHTAMDRYAGTLFYSLDIQALLEKINPLTTIDEFSYYCSLAHPYVLENGFYEVFSRLKHKITYENFQLKDLISIMNLIYKNEIPTELQPIIESAGLYKDSVTEEYVLMNMLKMPTEIVYWIDGIKYLGSGQSHVFVLPKHPEKILVEHLQKNIELFTENKIMKMKGKLLYERSK